MSSVGSYAANFHEGRRSEYIAQYFFSSLGTAVPVPTQEDTGLDLHCTIADRIGQRAWPKCFFTVQVKSEFKSWRIKSRESVEWLSQQPFPIFLCIVEKSLGRFRVFQTLARHFIHAYPLIPDEVELVPSDSFEGNGTQWSAKSTTYSLSAPILDFKLDQLLDDSFIAKSKTILRGWARLDDNNTHLRKSGIRRAISPIKYTTNELLPSTGTLGSGLVAKDELIAPAIDNLKTSLQWTAMCLAHSGNQGIAVRMALLLHKLQTRCDLALYKMLFELCEHLNLPRPVHVDEYTAGLSKINSAIDELLPEQWRTCP